MKKFLLCLALVPGFSEAKLVLGQAEYRYGPDTAQNMACQYAEERAKENAIARFVGEEIEVLAYQSCQNENCEMQKDTYNEVRGTIQDILSLHKEVSEKPGFMSCMVTVKANVVKVETGIHISLRENFFHLKHNDIVKFQGTVNQTGYLTVFNLYNGTYTKLRSTIWVDNNKEFVLPSEQDTTKLTAVVPEGKQQSKEMVMFLFTTTAQELKSSYTVNEMRNLLSSMPYQHRKVVNRYVNIVK
jgi:hypothetical protein